MKLVFCTGARTIKSRGNTAGPIIMNQFSPAVTAGSGPS